MQIDYKLYDKNQQEIQIGNVIKEIKIPNRRNGDETPHTNYYKVAFGEFEAGRDSDWDMKYKAIGFHVLLRGEGQYALVQTKESGVYAISASECEIVTNVTEIPKEFL